MLDLGHIERNLAKQALLAGEPIPERIANAPELKLGLALYLQAFFDLDSERSHGFGYVSIPWSKIVFYAQFNDFDEQQTEELLYLIRSMDTEHINRLAAKEKAGNGKP